MTILIGLWRVCAWVMSKLDTDTTPGRHRGAGRHAWYWGKRSQRTGNLPATSLVQWLIAERQCPGLSFVDWCREQLWREHQTWQEIRMTAGGW
jgi:hypothetical protein